MTRLQWLIVAVLACAAGFGGAYLYTLQSRDTVTMRSSGTALVGGPFTLVSHRGDRVSDTDLRGKYMLVFFGYTFCPDICPAGLQVMTGALEKLGRTADAIQPVFITIDPERDTVAVLADYMGHFHERLIGLTGSMHEIAAVAKAYRVYYRKAGEDDQDYLMDHSSIFYLMGPDGGFVKHFAYGTDPESLANDIEAAMASQ